MKSLTLILCSVLCLMCLSACQTAPTATQSAQINSGITVAVDVAAGFAIQQKDSDPAVWKARATQYKAIALQLQTINSAGTATLATLAGDMQPLIATLPPADQLAANSLVAALVPYLNSQLQSNPTAAQVQTTIAAVLNAVIAACQAYGA